MEPTSRSRRSLGWSSSFAEIAVLGPAEADEDYPCGMFVLNDEHGQSWLWTLKDGLMDVHLDPSFQWLDE